MLVFKRVRKLGVTHCSAFRSEKISAFVIILGRIQKKIYYTEFSVQLLWVCWVRPDPFDSVDSLTSFSFRIYSYMTCNLKLIFDLISDHV